MGLERHAHIVDGSRRNHSAWENVASVLKLFRKMDRRVAAKVGCSGSNNRYESRKPDTAPVIAVGEVGECLFGRRARAQDPYDHYESEESCEVKDNC